jgi:hypothetical protein
LQCDALDELDAGLDRPTERACRCDLLETLEL